ncbi:MAG: hypothetical protein ACOCRK_01440 [bacterium]
MKIIHNFPDKFVLARLSVLIKNFEKKYGIGSVEFIKKYNPNDTHEILKSKFNCKTVSKKELEEWEYRIKKYCTIAKIDIEDIEKHKYYRRNKD